MAATSTLTIEISADVREGLERLADDTDATPADLASEALAAYVEGELAIIHGIERGLSDVKAGNVVPHDAAFAEIYALIDAAQAKRS